MEKKPITLVILPGLDGTEVLFRPLLALLPDWIQPVVICYPASGPNEYADLREVVREKIAGLPQLHRPRFLLFRATFDNAGRG
jgi:hypothetical protein